MSDVACSRLLHCFPSRRFCLVAQRSSQGEGEERWVTRQKRLQGRLPIAQVEHKTPLLKSALRPDWFKGGGCNLKWMA